MSVRHRFLVLSFLRICSENNHLYLYWALVISIAGKKLDGDMFFRNLRSIWRNNFDHEQVHLHTQKSLH